MFSQLLNWRTVLALIAILIVSGTIWYSSYLAKKIEHEERRKVNEWVTASTSVADISSKGDTRVQMQIIKDNKDIPIIETNEHDEFIDSLNLDGEKAKSDKDYIKETIRLFKSQNEPVIWRDPLNHGHFNKYYFGHTHLLNEVRYYPLVQLLIVGLFIIITFTALRSSYRSTQNQVWAGMAKETAHQLGTPVSSLEGWVEILKDSHAGENFVSEMEKDVSRLRLVSDRFGKIGSKPQLEERNIVDQVRSMMEYIRKRSGGKVQFSLNTHEKENITSNISAPLFDWVIENLLKNALDAMEGKGSIYIDIKENPNNIIIDVSDTGKGISSKNINNVFKPGFTTKKRGWGLGLSLSKRIVEQYHKGSLLVKQSEIGKGTTFRIILIK